MGNAEVLKIVPLTSALLDVWLDFFDARAFSDNPEWRHCYCTFYHKPGPDGGEAGPRMTNRKRAIRLIEEGRMRGYLALEEGDRAVAWCEAGDRTSFARLDEVGGPSGKVLSVVCFVVQKDWRRRGAAAALLARVIADAEREGYDMVEAYPNPDASTEAGNYHGPVSLYGRFGFVLSEEGGGPVARKRLKP